MKFNSIFSAIGVALLSLAVTQSAHAFGDMASKKGPHGGGQIDEQAASTISGKVTETMNGGGYSYICLENNGKKTWVAVPQIKVKVGDEMAFYPGSEMPNFKSKTLNRTFDKIVFSPGAVVLPGTKADKATKGEAAAKVEPKEKAEKIKVEKAEGKNAYTVSELFANSTKLDGHEVVVKGKVVKVSENIMGMNWVHVQDGTGEPDKGNNNLVVTTNDSAEVGDLVTVTGKLIKDKDFGYGYKYDAMLEGATIKK